MNKSRECLEVELERNAYPGQFLLVSVEGKLLVGKVLSKKGFDFILEKPLLLGESINQDPRTGEISSMDLMFRKILMSVSILDELMVKSSMFCILEEENPILDKYKKMLEYCNAQDAGIAIPSHEDLIKVNSAK